MLCLQQLVVLHCIFQMIVIKLKKFSFRYLLLLNDIYGLIYSKIIYLVVLTTFNIGLVYGFTRYKLTCPALLDN